MQLAYIIYINDYRHPVQLIYFHEQAVLPQNPDKAIESVATVCRMHHGPDESQMAAFMTYVPNASSNTVHGAIVMQLHDYITLTSIVQDVPHAQGI